MEDKTQWTLNKAAGEMGDGAPEGIYQIAPHPKHSDIEVVILPNGKAVCRVKGYPLPAYLFEGDGEGILRPGGSRFYRVAGKGGISISDGMTLDDVILAALVRSCFESLSVVGFTKKEI